MPRWLRVIRGMIGTGLTFAAGVGVVGSLLGLVGVVLGKLAWNDLRFVAKLAVVSFIVGVAFSGVLAITARGRAFERLSLRYVTALGAGGGLLYFLFIAFMNGARVWSAGTAIANLTILTVLGAVSAAAILIIARKAGRALKSGEEIRSLSESGIEAPLVRRETEQKSGLRRFP